MPTIEEIARERVRRDTPEPVVVPKSLAAAPGWYTRESIEPFIIAQTERDGRKFYIIRTNVVEVSGEISMVDRAYRILVLGEPNQWPRNSLPGWPMDTSQELYENIGQIIFFLPRDVQVAKILDVNLVSEFHHKGLGTFMYKTAINDLISQGRRVQSDTVRSPQANRVWLNLRWNNPSTVKTIPHRGNTVVYEANGIVHRRPKQPVKRHKRRSK